MKCLIVLKFLLVALKKINDKFMKKILNKVKKTEQTKFKILNTFLEDMF